MKIAKHWSKATAKAVLPSGERWLVEKWGWSDVSDAEAMALATQAAQELADRVARTGAWPDRYFYGTEGQPMREEIVTEHCAADGRPLIVITRNSYGALVLNTAEAMFIDIDCAEQKPVAARGGGFWSGLFGKKTAPVPATPPEPPELQRLRGWAQSHPDWSLRVYKTKAGLRVLVTHALIAPESEAAQSAMRDLKADPLYVRLCRAQKCFRARLTPKPWRIDIHHRPPRYPYSDQDAGRSARWKDEYDRKSEAFATCSLLAELGPRSIHPSLAAAVELHDTATKISSDLPLA